MRRVVSGRIFATMMLHPLLSVLTPNIRPVTTALLSTAEKMAITRVVRVMLEYNLNYKQVKGAAVGFRRNPLLNVK